MSKKRPIYQNIEDLFVPSEVKKTRHNSTPGSDSHKENNLKRPRTPVSASEGPLHHDKPKATDRQGGTSSEEVSDAPVSEQFRGSSDKGNSQGSPAASCSAHDASGERDVPPAGPPVCWYSSEERSDEQEALQECKMDCTVAMESSSTDLCRTFLTRMNWAEPSDGSHALLKSSEEVVVGPTEVSAPLGLQQRRGEAEAIKCSFIGRNAEPSAADMVHPDLPVNLPQDTSPSSFSSSSSSSSCCCCFCPESTMCGSHHGHFPSDRLLSSVDEEATTLRHYKVVLSPPTNFNGTVTTTLIQDGKPFTFDGFSLWSAVALDHMASCTFMRFGHQHTARLVREVALEGQPPGVEEMLMVQEYLFVELLELYDWVRALQPASRALFFIPRFANVAPSLGGDVKHVLMVGDVLKCLLELRAPLAVDGMRVGSARETYSDLLVTFPGKQPRCLRVDRMAPSHNSIQSPSLVHFCTRRAGDSFVGNEEYQHKSKQYIRLLGDKIRGVLKKKEYFRLFEVQNRLRELRNQPSLKRDTIMEISCSGCLSTGLRADVMRQALVMPIVAHHVRFHLSLPILEETLKYTFHDKALLQMALTHPSFTLKYGTTPGHVRNSLTNCAVKRPEVTYYLNRTAGKDGLSRSSSSVVPFNNERLEYLGDAVIEYLCSLHLFQMFPAHREGQLASYRSALVQNKHLQQVAKELKLQDYLVSSHGPEFSMEGVFNHELANCFEAVIGAIFMDSNLEECDRVLSQAFFSKDGPDVLSAWTHFVPHPLQREYPFGDRFMIAQSDVLQNLTSLESAIGLEFDHIRLLAKACTHPSVEYNSLTRGHNQRLEFLGDAVLQFIVSWYLYCSFPGQHEGQLTMMRASLVNNATLAAVASDLGLQQYVVTGQKQDVPINLKLLADLTESLLAAVLLDKGVAFVGKFCEVCLLPRLSQTTQEGRVAMDTKTTLIRRLGQELRKHGLPWETPHYSVVERKGPSHNPVYTVTVSIRGHVVAHGEGPSIRTADMSAAKSALPRLPGIVKLLTREKKNSS